MSLRGGWGVVCMALNFEFQECWNKEKEIHKGTSVVVKMENPNWSMVELQSPKDDFQQSDKQSRGKNARQLTWVWLLKAHRAAGCVAWFAQGLWSLLSAVKRRVSLGKNQNRVTDKDKPGKNKLYSVIRGFLLFAILMLGFEIAAYMNGWHFSRPHFDFSPAQDLQGVLHSIYSEWVFVRPLISPLLFRHWPTSALCCFLSSRQIDWCWRWDACGSTSRRLNRCLNSNSQVQQRIWRKVRQQSIRWFWFRFPCVTRWRTKIGILLMFPCIILWVKFQPEEHNWLLWSVNYFWHNVKVDKNYA